MGSDFAKDSNPKDAIGSTKPPIDNIPLSVISENGMVTTLFDDEGNFRGEQESPYVKILARQQPMLIKILEKIGMSPRDITYLVNPEATSQAPIEASVNEHKSITYFR